MRPDDVSDDAPHVSDAQAEHQTPDQPTLSDRYHAIDHIGWHLATGIVQPDQQRLEQFAARCPHPIDRKLNPIELPVGIAGGNRPSLVRLGLPADQLEKVGDLLTMLEVDLLDVLLEARKGGAGADFLADPRGQPLVEEQ